MNGVAQRTANDCGVACLATLGRPGVIYGWDTRAYLDALAALFPHSSLYSHPDTLSTTEYRMRRGAYKLGWKLSRKRGVNGIEGECGLMFVRAMRDDWNDQNHWLAWRRDSEGRVWLWCPSNGGTLFEYKPGALHNRGMRLLWWVNAERK